MAKIIITLAKMEAPGAAKGALSAAANICRIHCGAPKGRAHAAVMEFHINRDIRLEYGLDGSLFSLTGNVFFADLKQCRELCAKFNAKQDPAYPDRFIRAGNLYAMGLIDEILHYVVSLYRRQVKGDLFDSALDRLGDKLGEGRVGGLIPEGKN